MRTQWTLVAAAVALAGCKPMSATEPGGAGTHGRYGGIGIYTPAEPWTKMVAAQQTKETPAAKPIDDQAIIVVVDSVSGEVRACGDLTGYCIGMNPWKTPLTSAQTAPINLTDHVKPPRALIVKPAAPAESAAPARE